MPETWAEGAIARYLTVGGATVFVWDATEWAPVCSICTGCGTSSRDGGPNSSKPDQWAQAHAETCRAMPRPNR
ncbi:hypothetical protein [Streptomyces sp. NPDC096033]|uniref:hypothetical protein n=1 Tax=Streptomyces sp. NPDC096033 TaxID=3366071 RepID=UPI003829CF25